MVKHHRHKKLKYLKSKGPHKSNGTFIVYNDKGLHTRPATELVKCVHKFKSEVVFKYQEAVVDGKSLLGILTLAAGRGAEIYVEAYGEDSEDVVAAVLSLAEDYFNIKY